MTPNYKVLGQVAPAASTLTSLYTVPAAKEAICSTLTVCNLGVSTLIRVAVRPTGEAINNKHYISYDFPLNANETLPLTIGITLEATDVVSVYAGHAQVAFSLFGSELS